MTKEKLKEEAKSNWKFWRLIFSGHFDYKTVFYEMGMDEIDEANAALDVYEEAVKVARDRASQTR